MPIRVLLLLTAVLACVVGWVLRPRAPRHARRSAVLPLQPRRVLVIKLADIGDALGIEPAVASLRTGFPGARIDVLVTPGARHALATCPHIDRLVDFDKHLFDRPHTVAAIGPLMAAARFMWRLRHERYDLVVLCHHLSTRWGAVKFSTLVRLIGAPHAAGLDNGRGGFLTHAAADRGFGDRPEWRYWFDIIDTLGIASVERAPHFTVPAAAQAAADTLVATVPGRRGPLVAIHPGVGGYAPVKAWPVERLAAVARQLADEQHASILVVGGADERDLASAIRVAVGPNCVDLTGQTNLATLGGLLRHCALVIGNDSGVVHLASAVGTRTLTIFGPTNADAWAPARSIVVTLPRSPKAVAASWPVSDGGVALRRDEPCSPCYYTGFSVRSRTPCAHRNCLQHLDPATVAGVAAELLSVP